MNYKLLRPRCTGLTLVEILISSLIALTIFGVIYNLFFWSLKSDKVTEEFTDSMLEARLVMLKINSELREARELIYPSSLIPSDFVTTNSIVFKDRNGIIKLISYDETIKELHLHSLKLTQEGKFEVLKGSISNDQRGQLIHDERQYVVGSKVESISYTYHSSKPNVLQFRIKINSFSLINSVRLLNV